MTYVRTPPTTWNPKASANDVEINTEIHWPHDCDDILRVFFMRITAPWFWFREHYIAASSCDEISAFISWWWHKQIMTSALKITGPIREATTTWNHVTIDVIVDNHQMREDLYCFYFFLQNWTTQLYIYEIGENSLYDESSCPIFFQQLHFLCLKLSLALVFVHNWE